jgi:hypothetical protein
MKDQTLQSTLFVAAIIVLSFIIAGCNYPEPEPEDTEPCTPEQLNQLVAPQLEDPLPNEVVSLPATLSWSDPNDCEVDMYAVFLWPMEIAAPWYAEADYPETSVETTVPVQAGTMYTWYVVPYIYSEGGETSRIAGPSSEHGTFFTGPRCGEESLLAPNLVEPSPGQSVDPVNSADMERPVMRWEYPDDCLPEDYRVLIARDPSFEEVEISRRLDNSHNFWQIDRNLEGETTYYWRVAVFLQEGQGPWSETRSFVTRPVDAELPGVVAGRIWHDECENPVPRDDYPPDYEQPGGCVFVAESVVANGVLEDHEKGIPGITVQIADGECPAASPGRPVWGPTDEQGWFYQFLPVGTYCVYIDLMHEDNEGRLMPGTWSFPNPDAPAFYTAEISFPGEQVTDLDFGWDFLYDVPEFMGEIEGVVWYDDNFDGLRQADEPGIKNVEVFLAPGDCGEDWYDRSLPRIYSEADGTYMYTNLEPGSYCLAVDGRSWTTAEIPDVGYPTRGYFTLPEDPEEALIPIELGAGERITDVNVGWTRWPNITAPVNVTCRTGPGTVYPAVRYYEVGQNRYLDGRLGNNTYWYTTDECWVAASVVETQGDPSVLPLLPIPPTPVPADTSPPSISVSLDPAVPDITDTVYFTATASDDRGVTRILIRVKPPGASSFSIEKECTNKTTCTYSGGPFDEGIGEFYAEAWDEAGNKKSSGTQIFTVEDPFL